MKTSKHCNILCRVHVNTYDVNRVGKYLILISHWKGNHLKSQLTAGVYSSLFTYFFVYVIVWVLGQLRINFTWIFKISPKLPSSLRSQGNFGKALKIQVKIILNCPRALSNACLSLKGQNFCNYYIRARCPRDETLSIPTKISKLT